MLILQKYILRVTLHGYSKIVPLVGILLRSRRPEVAQHLMFLKIQQRESTPLEWRLTSPVLFQDHQLLVDLGQLWDAEHQSSCQLITVI
jgi:hypothetical protein